MTATDRATTTGSVEDGGGNAADSHGGLVFFAGRTRHLVRGQEDMITDIALGLAAARATDTDAATTAVATT
ncbi:hypothetical protein [Streptomyces sp. NPDC001315]|uniref:hypothetical protein n=1 Tax=Streptomyces sp. NPDC001315 TaxID=3364562 RepID=UPI00367D555C